MCIKKNKRITRVLTRRRGFFKSFCPTVCSRNSRRILCFVLFFLDSFTVSVGLLLLLYRLTTLWKITELGSFICRGKGMQGNSKSVCQCELPSHSTRYVWSTFLSMTSFSQKYRSSETCSLNCNLRWESGKLGQCFCRYRGLDIKVYCLYRLYFSESE